jgi:MerR family copper efflux transcriptional regulator
MKKAGNTLRSGELAKLTGVSTDTLRHYERLGVLARPRRTEAGYRLYPAEALQRVQLVRRAISVGFSLPELVRILGVRDRGGAPCRQVRALAVSKLAQIDERMQELLVVRKHLEELIAIWDHRLERTPEGQRAGLLEMLSNSLSPPSRKGIKQ